MSPWVMPDWMEPYRYLINNTGGNTVEDLVNYRGTDASINALAVAVGAQVGLLEDLHALGLVGEPVQYVTLTYIAKQTGDKIETLRSYHKRAAWRREAGEPPWRSDLPAPDAPEQVQAAGRPKWLKTTADKYIRERLAHRATLPRYRAVAS